MTFATDRALIQAATDATLATAQDYLNRLVDISSVNFGGLPFNIDRLVGNITSFPAIPSLPDAVGSMPANTALRPTIPDLGLSSLSAVPYAPDVGSQITIPTPVSLPADDLVAPTSVFQFAEAQYASILLDPLKAKLLDNLINGGYGIEPADEIALFNRARDREVEAMMSRVQDAGRAMAARGFPLPPGELSIHIDRAYQEMQDKVSDVSRDITLQRNKLFVENRQFTIAQIRELEQVLLNYWNSVQERAFNVGRITAEFGITVYNALIARYKARLDAAKISSEVQFQQVQIQLEKSRVMLEVFRGQIAQYETSLRALIEPARLKVEMYRADVEANSVEIKRAVSTLEVEARTYEAGTQFGLGLQKEAIEAARLKLEAAIQALKFRSDGAKYGAEQYFAQLTALESSTNILTMQTSTM